MYCKIKLVFKKSLLFNMSTSRSKFIHSTKYWTKWRDDWPEVILISFYPDAQGPLICVLIPPVITRRVAFVISSHNVCGGCWI